MSFFNARADANRIVYVLDRESLRNGGLQSLQRPTGGDPISANAASAATPSVSVVAQDAFRQLTQWTPLSASERRENLVTESPLGYPQRGGAQQVRELSGFVVTMSLQRLAFAIGVENAAAG